MYKESFLFKIGKMGPGRSNNSIEESLKETVK